ncbi:MAG: polysaccharide biosynthesis/export family protein [Mucilaginibacter sp.]
MRILFTPIILVLFLICSSCSNKQYQSLFEKKGYPTDTVLQKNVANIINYRIKPQDILQIRNLQNSKTIIDLNPAVNSNTPQAAAPLSENFQVEDDGTIALTALGHVRVEGLTRMEAEKYIESLYLKDLKNPVIELKITNLKVSIFGEVKSQANYPLTKDRMTLVEMLGDAGGLTDKADEKNIKIIRQTALKPVVIQVDMSDIRSISDPKTILQSGDVIFVPENRRAVRNEKVTNFSQILQPGLLVFSTVLLIFTLARR